MTEWRLYGEMMAVVAAILFSWVAIFFTVAGRRIGVTLVNLLRVPLGALFLAATHQCLHGRLWPEGLSATSQVWLGLSGIVGLAIGDSALFLTFTRIGPRRGLIMMATAPVFTVTLAWFMLSEHLGAQAIAGIVVVIAGIVVATAGREEHTGSFGNLSRAQLRTGYALGLVAAAGQGLGAGFAKLGMAGGVEPLGATLVRMVWAALALTLVFLFRGRTLAQLKRLRDRRGVAALAGGTLLGPFISVWISLIAIRHTEAGVAQVLLSMVPIFVIGPSWLIYRDRPSWQSGLGVVVAVIGGALLFLR
jgi:drug/metabolite transporter (DMT)-like permease